MDERPLVPLRILILEDMTADAELILHELKRAGFDLVWTRVDSETDFLRELQSGPEIIISDFSMPQFDFFRAHELLKEHAPEIPIILVSGTVGEDVAVEAMRQGATDYLLKDRLSRLPDAVRRAMKLREMEKQKDLAEQALRSAEVKYRNLVEQLPAVTYLDALDDSNPERMFSTIYMSPQVENVLGYPPEAFLQDAGLWYGLIHPDDYKHVIESNGRFGKTEQPYELEHRMVKRSGDVIWVRDRTVILIDEQTGEKYAQGIMTDITDRKLAEDQVRRQLAHLTALAEIDRAIISSHDIEITLGTVVNQLVNRLSADAAAILLFDETRNTLVHAVSSGFRTAEIKRTRLKRGEGFAGRIALTGESLHVERLMDTDDGRSMRRGLFEAEGFSTYHGVPLIAKGKPLGVLEVFHRLPVAGPAAEDADWTGFLNTLVRLCAIAIDNSQLFQDMNRAHRELAMAYDATIEGWSRALDLRDRETEGHSQRVTEMTVRLAQHFALDPDDLVNLRWGALLHDIGKMGVPDSILLKVDPLTEFEWKTIKQHPVLAFEMLSPIQYLRQAIDIPYCHHEKWDGTGYPRGLQGEQIPFPARIFAVVDVWDALISDRPYRAAWPEQKALDYIRDQSGIHFDPLVVDTFFKEIARADRATDALAAIR